MANIEGSLALLKSQIARAGNTPGYVFGFGGGPNSKRLYPIDELLRCLGSGPDAIKEYFNLLAEPSVFVPWSKQMSEIISRPYTVEPGADTPAAQQAADFIKATLDNLGGTTKDKYKAIALLESDLTFANLQKWMGTAIITGLAPFEIVYGRTEQGLINIDRLIAIEPSRLIFDEVVNGYIVPRLRTTTNAGSGLRLPANKFVLHRYWAMPTISPYGQGLGRQLYWPVEWKKDALSLWMQIIVKHADPRVVGRAPSRASEDEIAGFHSDLAEYSSNGVIALREGYDVSTDENSAPAVQWVQELCLYADKMANLLLLGESTSGEAVGGSQARETINESIRLQKAKEFSDCILDSLNGTLVKWLCQINFPDVPQPKIKREFLDADLILDQAQQLSLLGISLDRDWLEQVTQLKFKVKKEK